MDLPGVKWLVRICIVWCPQTRTRGMAVLPGLISLGVPKTACPGQPPALRLPGRPAEEHRKGAGCGEERKCWLPPRFLPSPLSYPQTSLWLVGPPHLSLPAAPRNSLLCPCPCLILAGFSGSLTQPGPLQAHTPFTQPATRGEQRNKRTRETDRGSCRRRVGKREKRRGVGGGGRERERQRTAFTLLHAATHTQAPAAR